MRFVYVVKLLWIHKQYSSALYRRGVFNVFSSIICATSSMNESSALWLMHLFIQCWQKCPKIFSAANFSCVVFSGVWAVMVLYLTRSATVSDKRPRFVWLVAFWLQTVTRGLGWQCKLRSVNHNYLISKTFAISNKDVCFFIVAKEFAPESCGFLAEFVWLFKPKTPTCNPCDFDSWGWQNAVRPQFWRHSLRYPFCCGTNYFNSTDGKFVNFLIIIILSL